MKPKKENKKGGAIVSLIVGIIFVLLAIMCFIGDMDYLLGGKAKDLNEIAANVRPQKDDHVRTDSYLVLGNFARDKALHQWHYPGRQGTALRDRTW